MKKSRQIDDSKIFFTIIFVILAIVVFLLLKPFIVSIMLAAVLAYIFYPLYKKLNLLIKNINISALLITLLVLLVIIVPLAFFFNVLFSEAYSSYISIQNIIAKNPYLSSEQIYQNSTISKIILYANSTLQNPQLKNTVTELLRQSANLILKSTSSFLFSIPARIFQLFVIFFTLFFLLRDGNKIVQGIYYALSIKTAHKERILKEFDNALHATVYGNLLVAVIQGIAAAIGFYFLGISSFVLWGFLTVIAALIPYVGPPIIWVPLAVFRILKGYLLNSRGTILNGVLIFLYGFFVISTLDNILKPKIIGDRAKTHPLIIFFGIIGGLAFFGFAGIILGPIILTLFWTCFDIYKTEYLVSKT